MRTFVLCLVAAIAAASAGCSSDHKSTPAPSKPAPAPGTSAPVCTIRDHDRDALIVSTAPGVECTSTDGELHLRGRDGYVELWLVRGARSVQDGVARVPEVIKSEFTGFTATQRESITVAGAPAVRMMGKGAEADDSDPGTADVVVFTAGGRVFVACTHAESMSESARRMMMSVVQTAKAP